MHIEMPKEVNITLTPTEKEPIINCISTLEKIKKQMEDNDYNCMYSVDYGEVHIGDMEDTIGILEAILNAELLWED